MFQIKDSETKKHLLFLQNILGDVWANNIKKTRVNEYVYEFCVDYRAFDRSNIIDSHKYLIKKWYKIMFGLIKKVFMGLLISIVNASNHTKCVS